MNLSSRGDYAVRVVLELAAAGPGVVIPARILGERAGVPPKYLVLLLRDLQPKGIVRSSRGLNGGYTLGRDAAEITVGEVVRLMDGPLAPIACASRTAHVPCPTSRCQVEADCILRDMWVEVRDAIAGILDTRTFADLLERRRGAASLGHPGYQI